MTTVAHEQPLLACLQDLVRQYAEAEFCLEAYTGHLFRIEYQEAMDQLHVVEFNDRGQPLDWIEVYLELLTRQLMIRHGYVEWASNRRGSRWNLILEAYNHSAGLPEAQQVDMHRQVVLVDQLTHSIPSDNERHQPFTFVFSNL